MNRSAASAILEQVEDIIEQLSHHQDAEVLLELAFQLKDELFSFVSA